MRWLALAVVLVLVAPTWAAENKNGVAVIIGNKTYQGHIPAVDYAHNDAEAIKRYVVDILGFREGNIIDLRDATQAQFLSVFGNERTHQGKLYQYVWPGKSDVVVFYSGHGVPGLKDRRGFLLPVDADPDTPEINGYSLDLLYGNLSKVEARTTTVFLDTCFSGDSAGGMLIGSASPIRIVATMPSLAKGMTVITAAQGGQLASWDDDARHGLFTEHLLQALYGKADANGNGKVTVKEIKAHLDEEMTYAARRRFNRLQQATVLGDTDRVLASYPPGRPPARPSIEVAVGAIVAKDSASDTAIDWKRKVIHVKGFGAADRSFPENVWKRAAEEAAKVDAQTKLLEVLNGSLINSKTFVKNYQSSLDEKVKEIRGHVPYARQVGSTIYPTEDTAELVLELSIE
ncbi:MAG: caspase family protein [Candidatus Glassbacteria bacterium]|nr:caspase family protein [Candidatus Glassbacteria bacterium]